MSIKKRIVVIIVLILSLTGLISISKKYENKLENNIKIESKNNIFKNISNYKPENNERYIRYYEKNKNLKYTEIVTRVNIGLDCKFYNYITKTKDLGILTLVNKYSKLDENYIPSDLEEINSKCLTNSSTSNMLKKEAKLAFEKLCEDSFKNGTPVYGQSAYRSYERQKILYNNSLKNNEKEKTDTDTARPGHSEHQTGLTIDVSSNKTGNMLTFEKTKSFIWMKNNAYKYGFILRYPKGKESIHGYIYEPWHYRYVGEKVAKDMHENYEDLTYDEYYYKFIDKKRTKS